MCVKLLNCVDNYCEQHYNELLQYFLNEIRFNHFLSLVILLLVLLSSFIVSSIKSSR